MPGKRQAKSGASDCQSEDILARLATRANGPKFTQCRCLQVCRCLQHTQCRVTRFCRKSQRSPAAQPGLCCADLVVKLWLGRHSMMIMQGTCNVLRCDVIRCEMLHEKRTPSCSVCRLDRRVGLRPPAAPRGLHNLESRTTRRGLLGKRTPEGRAGRARRPDGEDVPQHIRGPPVGVEQFPRTRGNSCPFVRAGRSGPG